MPRLVPEPWIRWLSISIMLWWCLHRKLEFLMGTWYNEDIITLYTFGRLGNTFQNNNIFKYSFAKKIKSINTWFSSKWKGFDYNIKNKVNCQIITRHCLILAKINKMVRVMKHEICVILSTLHFALSLSRF